MNLIIPASNKVMPSAVAAANGALGQSNPGFADIMDVVNVANGAARTDSNINIASSDTDLLDLKEIVELDPEILDLDKKIKEKVPEEKMWIFGSGGVSCLPPIGVDQLADGKNGCLLPIDPKQLADNGTHLIPINPFPMADGDRKIMHRDNEELIPLIPAQIASNETDLIPLVPAKKSELIDIVPLPKADTEGKFVSDDEYLEDFPVIIDDIIYDPSKLLPIVKKDTKPLDIIPVDDKTKLLDLTPVDNNIMPYAAVANTMINDLSNKVEDLAGRDDELIDLRKTVDGNMALGKMVNDRGVSYLMMDEGQEFADIGGDSVITNIMTEAESEMLDVKIAALGKNKIASLGKREEGDDTIIDLRPVDASGNDKTEMLDIKPIASLDLRTPGNDDVEILEANLFEDQPALDIKPKVSYTQNIELGNIQAKNNQDMVHIKMMPLLLEQYGGVDASAYLGDKMKMMINKMEAHDTKSIQIQLHPQEFGKIEVTLDKNSDQTNIVFTVENAKTLELLQAEIATLETALQYAGITSDGGSLNLSLNQGAPESFQNFLGDNTKNEVIEKEIASRTYQLGFEPDGVDIMV